MLAVSFTLNSPLKSENKVALFASKGKIQRFLTEQPQRGLLSEEKIFQKTLIFGLQGYRATIPTHFFYFWSSVQRNGPP